MLSTPFVPLSNANHLYKKVLATPELVVYFDEKRTTTIDHDFLFNVVNTLAPKWIEKILELVDEVRVKEESAGKDYHQKMSKSMISDLEN